MIQENFKTYKIDLQWKIISRSQSAGSRSKSSICKPRPEACDVIHGTCLGHSEMFFGNPRAVIDLSQIPHQGFLHSMNQCATGGIPVQRSAERLVAKGEEQIGSTVPMPSFARRPSTMNFCSSAEIPQNSMADQQRHIFNVFQVGR